MKIRKAGSFKDIIIIFADKIQYFIDGRAKSDTKGHLFTEYPGDKGSKDITNTKLGKEILALYNKP